MKEGVYKDPEVAPTDDISSKKLCYLAALKSLGITQNYTEEITEFEKSPCPPENFHSSWAQYPGNT